ncbi:hypothetical protein VAEKB19_760003 [Vibrio aestuarianus]|nr:hypothetical protein VAEKB19_760003 [Vibrio aestuarianus]
MSNTHYAYPLTIEELICVEEFALVGS